MAKLCLNLTRLGLVCTGQVVWAGLFRAWSSIAVNRRALRTAGQSVSRVDLRKLTGMLRCRENELKAR